MERLAKIFQNFLVNEAKGSSTLYSFWSEKIADDQELLKLISAIPSSQPKPNLFFASVQYLALSKNHDLQHYLLNPNKNAYFLENSYKALKDFSKKYESELLLCFQTKLVQTNVINRATYLYPIFSEIAQERQIPLSLIEIGTSAGLLLNLDCYHYKLTEQGIFKSFGNSTSEVTLFAENFGKQMDLPKPFSIDNRIGIDLNIIDLKNDEDYRWMQALIWPEHFKRKELLDQARTINNDTPKELLEGDFIEHIPKIIENISGSSQVVIFHTHVANQFSDQLKLDLLKMLDELSNKKPIYHIYNNMADRNLHVDFINNRQTIKIKELKDVHGHGKHYNWI